VYCEKNHNLAVQASMVMESVTQTVRNKTKMSLQELCDRLEGEIICCEQNRDMEVSTACGCDLMSDVLAFTKSGAVLLTGLANAQVVRTAEMLDLKAVVFVRRKEPDAATVDMARKLSLVLIRTPLPLYESCGRLYAAGLSGCGEIPGDTATRVRAQRAG
jgi:hypothetical protein